MVQLPPLIQDLGIILVTAALVSLIFKSLKQPVVLGYLIAGVLVGPHFSFMPTVVDTESLSVWGEIGVIILLFSLGLEFSFKKLTHVGVSASITGIFEMLFMILIGFYTGRFLGWTNMDSLFLGGILSISSTTIIARAFDEFGLKGRKFVNLVFGVLIVEDLMAVLLLVLLSTVAVTRAFSGIELMFSTVKLMFFLIMWFVLGIYTLPILLRRVRPYLNDETMLIVSLGLCLLMVIIATKTGFSPALGAFVMGSLLAETRKGKAIELVIAPVKNLFAAIFFVSVGMLINPAIMVQYWGVILFLTAVLIVGKIIGVTTGALLSGQSAKISLQTGMSLAQIGEFSFIIATLGLTLGVTNERLYPIAVAVSALTTFTTPYFIRHSITLYYWLEKHAPEELKNALIKYQTDMSAGSSSSMLTVLWNNYGKKILLNGVVIVALTLAAKNYLLPSVAFRFPDGGWLRPAMAVITLIVASPFLWALTVSKAPPTRVHEIAILKTMRLVELVVSTLRLVLGVFFISFIVGSFISLHAASLFIFIGIVAIGIFLVKYSGPYYRKIETRFLSHLDDNEKTILSQKRSMPVLAPWNATFTEYILSADSEFVGKTLIECAIKEKFGVTVALIERGKKKIIAPGRSELLMPGDRMFLIGTDEQLEIVRQLIEVQPVLSPSEELEIYGLGSFVITGDSPFQGKSIRECGLRERVHGLIVGLERNEERLLNPDSAVVLEPGDLVWIVGDRLKIKSLS
jgi:monovalent cation:H+ antiporter-2, CPA2 family